MNENPIQKVNYNALGALTKPLSLRGIPPWVIYFTALMGLFYILNPTAGLIEFIPDNIPLIGNMDEGAAFMLLWYGLVEFFEGRKFRQAYPEDNAPDDLTDDPNIIDV